LKTGKDDNQVIKFSYSKQLM